MKSNDWRHKNVARYTPGNTKILYFFNCLLDGMHTIEDKGLIKRKIIEDNPPKIILYEIDGSNTGIREMIQATCFFQEIMRLEMVLA